MSARPQRQCPHCPPHSHHHGALPWCSRLVSGSSCSGQLDEEPGCSLSPVPVCLPQRLAGATLLIFANKQDLPGALSSNAIREALELDSIRSHHWCIQGCSAVTGDNLLPGIDWLLDDISSRIFTAD